MAEVETLQAKVQRVCNAFDKRFGADIWKPRLRDRKAGQSMADPERQDKLDRLEEVTIVQTAMLGRLERKYDEAIRRHDEELAELRKSQIALHEEQRKTEQSLQIMSAGLNSLRETVDRFIRGQEGNGRKQ